MTQDVRAPDRAAEQCWLARGPLRKPAEAGLVLLEPKFRNGRTRILVLGDLLIVGLLAWYLLAV